MLLRSRVSSWGNLVLLYQKDVKHLYVVEKDELWLVCLHWSHKTVLANAKADLAAPEPEPAMLITMLIRSEGVFESEGPGTPEFLMP